MLQPFSVLISVYYKEHAAYLDEALRSVFNQTVPVNEVVLVKDGPLTLELNQVIDSYVKQYPIKIVALPENRGLGEALNRGLAQCSYDLVARMDSDDICKRDRFEKQLQVFKNHPEYSVVGSWVEEFDDTPERVLTVRKLPETPDELREYAMYRSPMNHPSVMFRAKDVAAVGNYQHFYLLEDYFLWCRMLMQGYKMYNIQESLLYFRGNEQMFARRGGFKYALAEIRFFTFLRKKKFIGWTTYLKSIVLRFMVRMMPNKIRIFIYKTKLR